MYYVMNIEEQIKRQYTTKFLEFIYPNNYTILIMDSITY